jgi:hypothetical protein
MESVLRAWIEAEPDLALSELSERLAKQGVLIKPGALWHQLNKWNLTFKKNPARQRARARGRAAGATSMGWVAAPNGCKEAGIHWRIVDIDWHDAALWACPQGQTLYRISAARALEEDYLCGCSAPQKIDRADGLRQSHRRGDVSRPY